MKGKDGLPIMPFKDGRSFERWLKENHASHRGIWMKIAKIDTGIASISYAQAVDAALCWGWIDSQKMTFDERYWLQRFTVRGPKSVWSKINTGHVARLIKSRRMQPSGLKAVDAAKADGRWKAAYSSQAIARVPPDLARALKKSPKAAAFFATLKGANRYALLFRLQNTKKAELRSAKIARFAAMLENQQTVFPLI